MKRFHKFLSIFVVGLAAIFGMGLIQKNNNKINEKIDQTFKVRINEYFKVNQFYVLDNSITNNSFQFWIDIELNNGNPFWPLANSLVLSSNLMPLNTNLHRQSNNYFLYEVNNLSDNTFYSDFTVSLFGHSQVWYVDGALITKKIHLTSGQISGIVIGVLTFLLIIALIILFIIRIKNEDDFEEEVIEKNIYNEHHAYIDENGERFEWVNNEWISVSTQD